MASVRQLTKPNRHGKRPWVVDYVDANGDRRQATPKGGLKKDAEELRKQIERDMADGQHQAGSQKTTIAEAGKRYIEFQEGRQAAGRITKGSLHQIERLIRLNVVPYFGKAQRFADMTETDIEGWVTWLRVERKLAPVTIRSRLTDMSTFEKWAKKKKLTNKTLVPEARRELVISRSEPVRTPTKEQVQAIFEAMQTRRYKATKEGFLLTKIAVYLAAIYGMRIGEILGLGAGDIDLESGLIRIRRSLSRVDGLKSPKSAAGNRDLQVGAFVLEPLRQYARQFFRKNPLNLFFTTIFATPIDSGNFSLDYWRPLLVQAGIEADERGYLHFHSLRHFAASSLLAQGRLGLADVARLLGHASINMTLSTYAYALADHQQQMTASEDMAAALLPAECNKNAIKNTNTLILQ